MTLLSRDRARCIFCVTGHLQVACAFVVLGTNLAMRASDASCIVIDRDITEVVKSVVIPRRAADAKSDDASETPREKLMVEVAHGSIEVIVDAKANDTRIEAQFTVDGIDLKDAERRAQVVKLYAERSADGTIVVQPVFPGKAMARDSAKVTIRVPTCGDSSVKSVDGAISVRGITGALRVSTKSGSIKVTEHLGSVDATSTDGSIVIEGASDGVRATSSNGSIRVSLAEGNDHPFTLESKNGAIAMEVGTSFDGVVHMTSVSGALALVDPIKRALTPHSAEHSMTVEIGAAVGQSTMQTTNGSVALSLRGVVVK